MPGICCPEHGCGLPRYQRYGKTLMPRKVLRFFLIIPRLPRLFQSLEISKHLVWHLVNKSIDGKFRTVADSLAWAHMEENIDGQSS